MIGEVHACISTTPKFAIHASAGTESTVGSIVTITVSSGQGAATDPRLIGGRRRKYPNIKVKGPRRRKDDDEPETAVAHATPSGLLLGLLHHLLNLLLRLL